MAAAEAAREPGRRLVTLGLGDQVARSTAAGGHPAPAHAIGQLPGAGSGPLAILVGMDRDAIAGVVDQALAALPNVRGVNNHQGSAATADQATMTALMAVLRERDLFFLDSLTTASSVAYQSALAAGVPTARNRIFLDDDPDSPQTIRKRLQTLIRSARATGAAIAIGHPHPATLSVLQQELPRLAADGIRFVTLSELMALREAESSGGR
ncbi:MAG: divergent polysaccharide deacetylase family protein [Candidatus Krumholzibacteriia bacterium]